MIKLQSQGFEWDDGNREKCQKHGLTQTDIENIFQQKSVYIAPDPKRSSQEERFLSIGRSRKGKPMIVVFMLRTINKEVLIRPISARYMHQKEARKYEEEITKNEK